jgi:uncharacterized Zn finger protein
VRESAHEKGRRYLIEGRLTVERVDARGILARCHGSGSTYRLGWNAGSRAWYCECAARGTCSHLVALQLCVAVPPRAEA